MESKTIRTNPKFIATEWWLPEAGGDGGGEQIGLRESKVQASRYKISKAGDVIGSSDGKESACNAGDLGLTPGLGRSPGEGHGNPLQVFLPGESPWTEEPGGLQSMESQRVGHN